MSRQNELGDNPKTIQQIKFLGQLKNIDDINAMEHNLCVI